MSVQLAYFQASLQSVVAVLLLSLCGVFATRTDRMSPESRKSMAKISSHMMLPVLLISRVPQSDLTVDTLTTYWVLPAACFAYVGFGYVVSRFLCSALKASKHEVSLSFCRFAVLSRLSFLTLRFAPPLAPGQLDHGVLVASHVDRTCSGALCGRLDGAAK